MSSSQAMPDKARQGQASRPNPTVSTTPSILQETEGPAELLPVTLLSITIFYCFTDASMDR
jgi:hypothetical protein